MKPLALLHVLAMAFITQKMNLSCYIPSTALKMLDTMKKWGFGKSRGKLLQYIVRNSTYLVADR